MRIAYVTETFPPEVNGVALTAARAVDHLRAVGHSVQVLRPRQRGEPARDDADEWRTPGGPIPMYPDLRYGLVRIDSLRRRWALRTPDLVHVSTPGPLGWAALRAACADGLPCSADFRTNFHAYSRHYGLGWLEPMLLDYLRRLHARADLTFVPTQALAAQLAALGFERLQVVGRGVDAQRFSPRWRDAGLRRAWSAGRRHPVLLHVGRLAAEKNVPLALETFERLRDDCPRLRMVVVGDGPLRQRLQAAHPAVQFVGTKCGTELARHYASADLFVFPSLTDTFGNVTLEAMASGLVLVAFDAAAAAEHLRDGHSACLAPPQAGAAGDAAFVAAARRALASWQPDSALRRHARQAACRADWGSALGLFERGLCQVAAARPWAPSHAAMA